MKRIFLDSASTTYCNDEVINEMLPYYRDIYGNSSSVHSIGRDATMILNNSRSVIAKSINVNPLEIYFTSSGTEANNMAIFGIARANKNKGNHIISTKIEHQSVIDSLKRLEKEGFVITYLDVDKNGQIFIQDLINSITTNTILVSVMLVNNEVGTISNIKEIAGILKEKGIIFHTDAVAGFGILDIDAKQLNVDAISLSAQKIYGPKGVGCLYIKQGTKFEPIIYGGNQENGKRAGTTNIPAIVGFAKAVDIMMKQKEEYRFKIKNIKNQFIENLKELKDVQINGNNTVDTILSITFKGISNELLQTILDLNGICCSLGSACTAGSTEPSHVLLGMGYSIDEAKSTIRFSFHKNLSKEDVIFATQLIKDTVKRLRGSN